MKYIVITPAKNEEKNIASTLASLCAQTIKPLQWLILNDNSSDKTAQIVQSYYRQEPCIKLINNARFIKQQRPFPKEVSALLRKEQWHLLKQFFHLKFWQTR